MCVCGGEVATSIYRSKHCQILASLSSELKQGMWTRDASVPAWAQGQDWGLFGRKSPVEEVTAQIVTASPQHTRAAVLILEASRFSLKTVGVRC